MNSSRKNTFDKVSFKYRRIFMFKELIKCFVNIGGKKCLKNLLRNFKFIVL